MVSVSGNDLLIISSDSESWTEIQDATGQRLFFRLLKQGQDYSLKGQAPFRIFLGNAPSVKIRINGQAVNLSEHIRRNNIANILLNGDASINAGRRTVKAEPQDAEPVKTEQTDQPVDDDSSRDLIFDEAQ